MTSSPGIEMYLFNEHRRELYRLFENGLDALSKVYDIVEVYITGSFLSDKETPKDIDVLVVVNSKSSGDYYYIKGKGLTPYRVFGARDAMYIEFKIIGENDIARLDKFFSEQYKKYKNFPVLVWY